jgi:hypothetical protein
VGQVNDELIKQASDLVTKQTEKNFELGLKKALDDYKTNPSPKNAISLTFAKNRDTLLRFLDSNSKNTQTKEIKKIPTIEELGPIFDKLESGVDAFAENTRT